MLVPLYLALAYLFIFLPVLVLVLFSFQGSTLPVPPFNGPSLRWYGEVLADGRLLAALGHSLLVGVLSSLRRHALLGFLAAYGLARDPPRWAGADPGPAAGAADGLLPDHRPGPARDLQRAGPAALAAGRRHRPCRDQPAALLCHPLRPDGRAAGAASSARRATSAPPSGRCCCWSPCRMLWPALFAAFFLSFTFSWDEFIIAFLLTRFDVTLPVEIWSALRTGLNPATNAVGSLVFGVSIVLVLLVELVAAAPGHARRERLPRAARRRAALRRHPRRSPPSISPCRPGAYVVLLGPVRAAARPRCCRSWAASWCRPRARC